MRLQPVAQIRAWDAVFSPLWHLLCQVPPTHNLITSAGKHNGTGHPALSDWLGHTLGSAGGRMGSGGAPGPCSASRDLLLQRPAEGERGAGGDRKGGLQSEFPSCRDLGTGPAHHQPPPPCLSSPPHSFCNHTPHLAQICKHQGHGKVSTHCRNECLRYKGKRAPGRRRQT